MSIPSSTTLTSSPPLEFSEKTILSNPEKDLLLTYWSCVQNRYDPSLECKDQSTSGAISWFNPTEASYSRARVLSGGDGPVSTEDQENSLPNIGANDLLGYKWTSRDNRRGRHTLVVSADALKDGRIAFPPRSGSWEAIRIGELPKKKKLLNPECTIC